MVGPEQILAASILIVDDASVNVLLLEHMLRGAGYTAVTTTTDPRVVCQLYRDNRYDLIVLDLLMPDMDGFAVMRGLKEIETESYLPVLVLTAEPDHKLRALGAGAKDFVSKPFDRIEVLTRIHHMLEVRLLLREARNYGRWLERFDQITGLPNRTYFRDRLTRALARCVAKPGIVATLAVVLDQYQALNDAHGRVIGDALLRVMSDRLVGCIGPLDTVARYEGGEFGLMVIAPRRDTEAGEETATKVREALRPAFDLEGREFMVTAGIGIATAPPDASETDELMRCADLALRAAEDAGPDQTRVYAADMMVEVLEAR